MSEGLLDKRFILKRSNAVSLNYPLGERIYDTILKTELNNSEIVDELNKLDFENEELVKKYFQLKEENEQLRNKLEVANARSSYYQRMLKKWCVK